MPAFAKTSEGIGHGFGECLHLSGEVSLRSECNKWI